MSTSTPPVGTSSHGSWLITSEASPTMLPQLGPCVSGVLRPRNDNALCTSTAAAANKESWTMIGPASRGSTCRHIMRALVSPDSRAALMYVSARIVSVDPRTTRSSVGQLSRPSATMVASSFPGNTDRTISRTMIPGSASTRSPNRAISRSVQPPVKPATRPRMMPRPANTTTASTTPSRVMRPPSISRLSTSRPRRSVPSQWAWRGPESTWVRSSCCGLSGASHGAPIARIPTIAR